MKASSQILLSYMYTSYQARQNAKKMFIIKLISQVYDFKLEALTCMVGIVFYNAFAGRIGEWAIMLRQHVEDQRCLQADHLVCAKHKTSFTYGALAKHFPPGP